MKNLYCFIIRLKQGFASDKGDFSKPVSSKTKELRMIFAVFIVEKAQIREQ